jgi:hypothetical protein
MANVNLQKTEQTDLLGYQQRASSSLYTNSFKYADMGEVTGTGTTVWPSLRLPGSKKGERNAFYVTMTAIPEDGANVPFQDVLFQFADFTTGVSEFGTTTALENLLKYTVEVNIVGDASAVVEPVSPDGVESPKNNAGQPTVMWTASNQLFLSRRNAQNTEPTEGGSLIACKCYVRILQRDGVTPANMNP